MLVTPRSFSESDMAPCRSGQSTDLVSDGILCWLTVSRCCELFHRSVVKGSQEASQCQFSVTRSLKMLQIGTPCPRPMVVGETPTPHTTQSLRLRRGFFFAQSHGCLHAFWPIAFSRPDLLAMQIQSLCSHSLTWRVIGVVCHHRFRMTQQTWCISFLGEGRCVATELGW